jgi:uncharacterized protein YecE (DUF72 family)
MGRIKVGTASWTDRTLLESGWYPPSADTPQRRLAHYASRFPLVEVDATYYAPPAERTVQLWAARTPADFTVNVKAFSLLTGHPTRVSALYRDLRPRTEKRNLYPADLTAQAYEEVWSRFLAALEPLARAGKLGAVLFQFPPWFTIRRTNKQYLLEVRERCAPMRAVVELRHASWFAGDNAAETLDFLRRHRLPYVCVDMPQGYRSSVPPVLAATADLAMVRFHGHSTRWDSRDIYQRFGYRYSERELAEWAPKLRGLAEEAAETHVLLNNCHRDYAQRNAERLTELLRDEATGARRDGRAGR